MIRQQQVFVLKSHRRRSQRAIERQREKYLHRAQAQSEARRAYVRSLASRGDPGSVRPITLPKLKFLDTADE